MDKMNQVSVTEFMSKSKEEMYDMAVEMVEKYNRLVDICNDSAERIAELIERHTVYTNALNQDIAAKAAKIELMQKEIDGRKAGYVALKTQMDTKYISIEEHDMINKSLDEKVEIYEKEIERLNRYTTNLETANNKDIADKAAKIDLLEKEIEGRKAGYVALKARMDSERESAAYWKDKYTKLQEENDEIDKDSKTHYDMYKYGEELLKVKDAEYNNMCQSLTLREEEIENLKKELDARGEEIRKLNKCIMNKNESINTGNEVIINLRKEICVHEEENKRLSEKIMELKDTITELTHDIDNYQSWNADLHNDIKDWKATADANGLENQRFRLKIVKLEEEIEKLKVDLIHEREKNEKLAKAHAELENDMRRYTNEIEKLKNEKANMEDDHGREGFKRYIKYIVKEEETKFEESWKARLNEELEAIFKEEEEEETEVKGNGRTSSGRYPWGAKVNDIPCGEDSIE